MTEDEELEPEENPPDGQPTVADPLPRKALKGPGGDKDKALGLEMARLFGVSPRLLVRKEAPPPPQPSPEDQDAPEGGSEAVEGGDVGD